jgi:hypothetical protein
LVVGERVRKRDSARSNVTLQLANKGPKLLPLISKSGPLHSSRLL